MHDRTVPESGAVIEARARSAESLAEPIIGGTIGVAESQHQSLDSESMECRDEENRRDWMPAQ